jgi:hypothetical protein
MLSFRESIPAERGLKVQHRAVEFFFSRLLEGNVAMIVGGVVDQIIETLGRETAEHLPHAVDEIVKGTDSPGSSYRR